MKHSPPDIHEEIPPWQYDINYVGINKLITTKKINIVYCQELLLKIDAYVNLPSTKKGVHLSRTLKVINNIPDNYCHTLESFLSKITSQLLNVHEYSTKAMIVINTTITYKENPVNIRIEQCREKNGETREKLTIETMGITACPCAKEVYRYFEKTSKSSTPTHMQRAILKATIISNHLFEDEEIVQKTIEVLQQSFSAPLKQTLDRIQEYNLIKKAINNPMFAEDVIRKAYHLLKQKVGGNHSFILEITSQESIHPFNVYARLEYKRDI